jgi:hypothetical protein
MMLRSSLIQWSAGLDPALAGIRRVILWMNVFCMFLDVTNSRTIFKRDLPRAHTTQGECTFPNHRSRCASRAPEEKGLA